MTKPSRFPGWFVAWTAFTIAVFAWGVGFYGPSVFLQSLHATRGWSIATISSAITLHFLFGAAIIVYLPALHERWGIAATTGTGAVLAAAGLFAWSGAWQPWQLFAAAAFSGAGWAATSGAALNAMIAPWFDRERPKALGLAFNGASVGGIVFVPLWIMLIGRFGFPIAANVVGLSMIAVVSALAFRFLRHGPSDFGLHPEGAAVASGRKKAAPTLSRFEMLRDRRFATLSTAFALGLFAQIGLFAHLIIRMSPTLGTEGAGAAVSAATVCAVIGRTVVAAWLGDHDRRVAAALNFAVQAAGVCLLAFGAGPIALWAGCALFGLGVGNLTTLPPLIAQQEFGQGDVGQVVALVIAVNQAAFAFAPAIFGALQEATAGYAAPFLLAAILQICAALTVVAGRSRSLASVSQA